jgi:hypothetical protein
MALTKKEREFIIEMSRRQDQLERMMGSALGGPLGRGFVMLDQEAGEREFLLNRSNESNNLRVGSAAKKGGMQVRSVLIPAAKSKARRKVSGYQKEFGRQFKKLKKAHPRTKPSSLMKRAHKATKRIRK